VGEGSEKANLEKYTADEKIQNVSFVGYKSGAALQSIVRRAMFSVLPSESYELFGHTILESFACGKPVIASRIGGIPELVREGENGHLFEPGNAAALSSRISDYIANPVKVKEMGKTARFIVERDYSPQDHYQKLIAIYRTLTS
jgi:glycosyltransferase involved in cell wall biosynthesis